MKRPLLAASCLMVGACVAHPPPPPAPYRAVAQAPADWTLIIDDRYLTFIGAPGAQPILQPSVKPIIGIAGEIYRTPRFNVNVVHSRCSDGRSSRSYPDSIQLTVDGRQYRGCGGL